MTQEVLVRPQETPNPSAIKFISNQTLKTQGKATIHSSLEWPGSKLIEDLFALAGVKQLHLFQNTITVTHSGELGEEDLMEQVISVIKTRVGVHNPDFSPEEEERLQKSKSRENLSPEMQKIEEILDRTIRPGLQSDGGDIEVLSFDNNQVRVLYQGACGGCPSSLMGTLDAIQSILSHELQNPDLQVVPI